MYKARYYKADGAEDGRESLPDWLFDGVVNEPVLHQVVKAYLANQRQGTAAAKTRGQVAGGSRKPWRQKGTGRARQGTIRAVQWEGGGVAFPPIPHSWRQRIPKKAKALARRSAFNSRAEGDRVVLVDALEFETPKTARLRTLLRSMGVEGKVLVLTDGPKENVYLSARNLRGVEVRPLGDESAYDILWAGVVVIEKDAIENAEPSGADNAAAASRARGEPEVRKVEAEAVAAKAARREERRASVSARRRASAIVPKAESAPKKKPKAKAAAPEAAEASAGLDDIKLPKVGDLAEFLAGFDSVTDVEALQARDGRKTAQTHYEARLAELKGGEEGGDDA